MFLIAQLPNNAEPNQIGLDILGGSAQIANDTAQAWNDVWPEIISPEHPLWIALIRIALIIAAISILYLSVTEGKDIVEKNDWIALVAGFVPVLSLAFFLAGNGGLLADTVLLIRGIAVTQVNNILDLQIYDLSLAEAIEQGVVSIAAKQQMQTVLSECQDLIGEEMQQCITQKAPRLQEIATQAQENGGLTGSFDRFFNQELIDTSLNPIENITNFLPGALFNIVSSAITGFLWALQWSFINILEAATLLTALWSPVALSASLLPLRVKPIVSWLIGFISLFAMQLSYNILIGLMAAILVQAGGFWLSDLAFAVFISVFAPGLAVILARGGGTALYQAINSNVGRIQGLITNLSSTLVGSIATKIYR